MDSTHLGCPQRTFFSPFKLDLQTTGVFDSRTAGFKLLFMDCFAMHLPLLSDTCYQTLHSSFNIQHVECLLLHYLYGRHISEQNKDLYPGGTTFSQRERYSNYST